MVVYTCTRTHAHTLKKGSDVILMLKAMDQIVGYVVATCAWSSLERGATGVTSKTYNV